MITLSEIIARMKREIRTDVRCGRIPDNVKSFAELHDYVDANSYGGLCDDATFGQLSAQFGRGRDDDMPSGMSDFITAAQNSVNDWLATGNLSTIRDVDLLGRDHDMARTIKDLRDECKRWAHRYHDLLIDGAVMHDKLSSLRGSARSLADRLDGI